MDELLLRPIHRQNGLLMGLKSGTTDTAQALEISGGALFSDNRPVALKTTVVGAVTYIGEASPGTTQASANWRAHKVDTTTGTVITWADNGKFSQVATDLTTLIYS